MATKTIYVDFPTDTERNRSQTINIQDVGEPITVSANTGSASYSISGRDVTVNVSGGAATGTITDYKYDASGYINQTGSTSFPAKYSYNDGTYVGDIPKNGSYYSNGTSASQSFTAVGHQTSTLVYRYKWSGSSWSFDTSWVEPDTMYYSDVDGYSGTLYYSSWDDTARPVAPPNSAGAGQPAGYTTTRSCSGTAGYQGLVTKPGSTIYRQDYYGTAVRNVNTYAYTVTLTYTVVLRRPTDFNWTYAKTSGVLFNLTAVEWNDFCTRINDFRRYKTYANASFTTAYSGNNFTAYMYNETINAINTISTIALPNYASAGDVVTASGLNKLVTCLNSTT